MGSVPFELLDPHGKVLRGDFIAPAGDGPWPVVVVCHGFKGFKNWGFFPEMGRRLGAAGFATVLFNFTGSGVGADLLEFTAMDAFAADTVSAQLDDLGRVLDAVQSHTIGAGRLDCDRLAVLGHSRGGAVAILRARTDRRIGAVVSWSGISTFWRYSEREIAAWKSSGFMEFLNTRTGQQMRIGVDFLEDLEAHRESYGVLDAVQELEAPLLLVHGSEDLSVPEREARELHMASGGLAMLHIIRATGHTFGVVHPWAGSTPAFDEATQVTIDWLRARLHGAA